MAGLRQVISTVVAGVAIGALLPSWSEAATYTVWSCRGPAGEPLSARAWAWQTVDAWPGDVAFADTCAQGGGLRIALVGNRTFSSPVVGMATFAAPAGTRLVRYELWRSLAVAPPQLLRAFDYAAVVAARRGGASTGDGCTTHNSRCVSAGDPDDPLAAVNHVAQDGSPLDALQLQVSCLRSWCQEPSGTPARVELYRARVVIDDPAAPAPPRLSGDLLAGAPVSGRSPLTVSSSDAGAGIASMSLWIDGGAPSIQASDQDACREPYVSASPCPAAVTQSFSIDAGKLAAGTHTASGTVTDAAGNVTAWGPQQFTVEHPAQPNAGPPGAAGPQSPGSPAVNASANGRPAVTTPRLALSATPGVRAPGAAARLAGTLRTAGGVPIAGARLTLTALDLGVNHTRPRTFASPTTDARGRFTATLRRDGMQRVTVAFAPDLEGASTAVDAVTVRTRLELTAAPDRGRLVKGRAVTLAGRLRGAGASAAGAPVRVESIVNGRWTTVGVVKADAGGRFRWRYRFVHLLRDTTFSFRTVVDSAPGWPWKRVQSERMQVDVDIP